MKRIISALLAAVTLIPISSISSCGSGEILTGVYSSEQISLPDGFAADTIIRTADGFADGFAVVSLPDDDMARRFVRLDSELNVTDSGEITTSNAAFLPDGDIVYPDGADILRSGNKPLSVPYIGMTKPGMVDDAFAGYTETSPVATDSDGNILFVGQFKAMVVSSDLELIGDVPTSGAIESYDLSPDGRFMLFNRSGSRDGTVSLIDPASGKISDKYSIPEDLSAWNIKVYAGSGGRYYVRCSTGIYACEGEKYEYICDFLNSDMSYNKISDLEFIDDDHFLAAYDGGLYMMTAAAGREMAVRAVISVAGIGIPEFLAEKAVGFNRENKENTDLRLFSQKKAHKSKTFFCENPIYSVYSKNFRVVLTDYSVWNEISADVMKNEIIAGRIPDIIIFGSDPYSEKYREKYIRQGMFTDLGPYLENDENFSADDLLSGVLRLGETNGVLYELPTWVAFELFSTGDDSVPDGWTLREFIDWGNSHDRSVMNSNYTDRKKLLWYMLTCSMDEFIDEENAVCDFDCDLFRDALTFAKDCRMSSGGSALNYRIIDAVDLWRNNKSDEARGNKKRLVGFPSGDGNGVRLNGGQIFTISRKSDVKDAAWRFISMAVAENGRNSVGNFGFTKTQIRSAVDCVRDNSYVKYFAYDGTERSVPPEEYTPDTFDTTKGVVVRLDESDADEIINLLDGAGKSVSENSKLWSIISEEAEIYFAGAKDLDETVKVIQSRVSTYISERN